jgi:hypothetical protein
VSRHHGRNGAIYIGVTNGAAASSCATQAAWTLNKVVDKVDVTSFGDGNKVYVAGLPDASGDFSGFWDDSTAQTYTATTDGLPRNMYLYPDIQNAPNAYFFGTVLPDFSIDGGIAAAVTFKSTWNAASRIWQYNPALGGVV